MKKIPLLLLVVLLVWACKGKKEYVGGLETEQITFNKTYCLNEACLDSFNLSISVEWPVSFPSDTVLSRIQSDIIKHLFSEQYMELSLNKAIEEYAQMAQEEYIANNSIFADEIEINDLEEYVAVLSQQQIYSGRVLSFDNDVFSYGIEIYVYMGGAHGMNTRYFYNYDTATGDLITEEDIFVEGYEKHLTAILQQLLVEQSDTFESKEEMISVGYDFDRVVPNGNFSLSTDTITYLFNPYDIAPYAFGETEIVVDKSIIENLLKR